ncbi:unnamed protein product [Angiostrongylus costaricensis]|uniref:Gag-pol polyprotein n=1 Tax=Angiostrongylus costaricensis TaxID=334426 RepID=A0A0R3PVA0_ANGCS|nr:unnamed protein product [Angiostrongylus costaricensis]
MTPDDMIESVETASPTNTSIVARPKKKEPESSEDSLIHVTKTTSTNKISFKKVPNADEDISADEET